MKKPIRNILFILFLLLFLVMTPSIILYAFGYSLNLQYIRLEPTGALVVRTDPAGAKILINNQPRPTFLSSLINQNNFMVAPARVKNITPGDYDIKLTLDNYHSWQKKLTIGPGASVLLKDVRLFKDSQPQAITDLTGQSNDVTAWAQTVTSTPAKHPPVTPAWLKNNKFILDDFYQGDWYLYLVGRSLGGQSLVWVLQPDTFKILKMINLPINSSFEFVNPTSAYVNLWDKNNQNLYLLEHRLPLLTEYNLTKVPNQYTAGVWVDNDLLLYHNDWEIWLWRKSANQATLLTRLGEKITQVAWHPSNHYILFSTNQTINVLELDNRDNYNTTQLLQAKQIKKFLLNSTGDAIYFYGQIDKQENFYKLDI